MGKITYYDMNKSLCKELCCEFEKFEETPKPEILHNIHKLIDSMVGLTELEAAGAMREYLEDKHGYDSRVGEFRGRSWSSPYGVYNAARIPTYTYTGVPYGTDWDDRMYNRGDNERRDNRDGDYMNDGRGRSRDSRGRYNDGRGMDGKDYPYGIYNIAHMDGMKHKDKLSDKEIKEWMEGLESESGERGPMWTKEEIESVAKKEGINFDKFSLEALFAATNMMYSDYCETGEKFNVDRPAFYISLAKNFLVDPDSIGGEDNGDKKLAAYYEYIVEH